NSIYYFYGDRVFNILAKHSFVKFALNFDFPSEVLAFPIDDHTRHDFSHCAILAKQLKSKIIKPKYNSLKATNIVKYAG
ncbi:ComF family protein, partial [Aliarcobacter butzleri]